MVRHVALVIVDLRHGDHVALVGGAGDAGAVQRLQPLGRRDAGREPARHVHGDVVAADRDRVSMHEMPAGEDAERGGAAAHIDHDDAHLGLVVDQHRKSRGVGRGDDRLDLEMAALDREHDVSRRRRLAGDDMHVDRKLAADQPARIEHARHSVQRIAGRQRMEHGLAGTDRMGRGSGQHALDVAVADGAGAQIDARRVMLRADAPAGQVDDDRLHLDLGHAFGRIDRGADRALGAVEIDDRAALQPQRTLMADADDTGDMGASAQSFIGLGRMQLGDQADDLAGADVEDRQRRALARGKRAHARRQALGGRMVHASPPFFLLLFFSISARALAPSSVSRITTRSDWRRSIAMMSFSNRR